MLGALLCVGIQELIGIQVGLKVGLEILMKGVERIIIVTKYFKKDNTIFPGSSKVGPDLLHMMCLVIVFFPLIMLFG